jgi:hypothetical protein
MNGDSNFLSLAVEDLKACIREDRNIIEFLKTGHAIALDRYIYRFTRTSYGIYEVWVADCLDRDNAQRIGLFDCRSRKMVFGDRDMLERDWEKFTANAFDAIYLMNIFHILEAWPAGTIFQVTHETPEGRKTENISREIFEDIPEEKTARILRIEKDGKVLIDRKTAEESYTIRNLEEED